MTIQRADTFASRTVASGFGTASDGHVWTINAGDGQSVGSNEGKVTGSSASTFATLGASLATADGEGVVRFQVPDSTNTLGIILRWTDANNYYLARYDGAGNIAFFKNVGGTKTTVGSYAISFASGFYWLKFHVAGSTIEIRTWQDGTGEPGTWNYTTTDTSLSGSGGSANKVGLYGFANTGSNEYDSFTVDDLVSALTGSVTLSGKGAFVASGSTPSNASATLKGHGAFVVSGHEVITASVSLRGRGAFVASPFTPGTGIGDITRSTGTQTANKSGNGYGAGDITGTEHDYSYTDATGSGWAIGANPWYGGMPSSAWYQIDPTLNTTLPQRTSLTGNLMSLLTTQSGGQEHWEEDSSGGFQSSELVTFQNAGNFTELAPANTPFRAYLKAIGDAADGNGISWTAYMCAYPGDPGLVVFRFDQHNGTGSAISVDESDIELIASLLTDTGSNPTGAWNASNGFIGTIGGSVINGWPADSVHQAGTFDYCGITPDVSSGLTLGIGAAVLSDPSVDFGWTQGGYEAHISAASGSVPGRIKFGFYSDVTSNWTIPAGQTNTYYVLRVFRRNLTSAGMAAIAADYKFPGTPTTTAGSYTSYSVDERAYVYAASALNTLATTLDLSPAHVTVRYKPVVKVTGWAGGVPQLTWGGVSLVSGVDYRHYEDTTNHVLYLQLYYDVVASGAVLGQRNNAALNVQPVQVGGAVTLAGRGGFSAAGAFETIIASVSLKGHGGFAASGHEVITGHPAILSGRGAFAASGSQQGIGSAALKGQGGFVASGHEVITGHAATLTGRGAFAASGHAVVSGHAVTLAGHGAFGAAGSAATTRSATLAGRGTFSTAGFEAVIASVRLSGQGAFIVSVAPPPPPSGIAVALTGGGPSGVVVIVASSDPAGGGVALASVGPVGVGVTGV